jgi:hypothetical protein
MPRPPATKLADTAEMNQWVNETPRRDAMVWVTPKRAVRLALPTQGPPKLALCRVFKQGEAFVLHPVSLNPCVRKTPELCRKLGLDISDETLDRLIDAGLVKATRPTPFAALVDLESLFEHLEQSALPGYWNRERRLAYMTALDREVERKQERETLKKERQSEATERKAKRTLGDDQYKRKETSEA